MRKKKVSDEELIHSYNRLKSIWKVAEEFNMCGQSVWERLSKLGIKFEKPNFTDEEIEIIKKEYNTYADKGKLDELAKKLGRDKTGVVRIAKKLGLTNQKRKKGWTLVNNEKIARKYFNRFKKTSRLTLKQFCNKQGISDTSFWKACKKFFPGEYDVEMEKRKGKARHYKRGREFEYRVRDFLEKKGFFVLRSPASKGPIDLVAIKKGVILIIQCKRSGYIRFEDREYLYDLAINEGANPLYVTMKEGIGYTFFEILKPNRSRRSSDNYKKIEIT